LNTKSLLDSELSNGSYISARGKDVIVIGGGDTGNDCIGTAMRHGAKSVTNFELLPSPPNSRGRDNPWPQWPRIFRTDYGHHEVAAHFNSGVYPCDDVELLLMVFLQILANSASPQKSSFWETTATSKDSTPVSLKILCGPDLSANDRCLVRVEWTKDSGGRWKMEEIPGSEKFFPAQLVLLALGFLGPQQELIKALEVKTDGRSNILTANKVR
jgi:glutamate synthase (NADPH/NADH)